MKGIKFGQQREDIHALLKEWQEQVDAEDVDGDLKDKLRETTSRAFEVLETDAQCRVSLLGEFSAGKSSLIMALTKNDVKTGAGPTTEEAEAFEWKGVTLIDTPGVQAERFEIDHDEIARKSTTNADLILFVLTNELFNQRLVDYFHSVAGPDGLDLADKMLVIVNKMDRETNKDEVIISEVENAISPLHTRVHLAAVELYLKSQHSDGDRRERLEKRSRIPDLMTAINGFIEEKGAMGRLTRPLQLFEDDLEKQRGSLLGDNEGARQELEFNRQQRLAVYEADSELNSLEIKWGTELRRIVLSRTSEKLNSVKEAKTGDAVGILFQEAVQAVEPEIESHFVNIANGLQNWARNLQEKVEELDMSELGKNIRNLKASAGPSGEFEDSLKRGFDFVDAGRKILDEGVRPLLDYTSENPAIVKNGVKYWGQKFGKKFKPWGASKQAGQISKWAKGGGRVLGPLMVAMEYYTEYRNEKTRDEQERHLAKTRLSMQRQFLNIADDHVNALRNELNKIRMDTIQKMLDQLEEQAAKITADDAKEKGIANLSSEFISRSRSLRNEISTVEN